MTIISKAPRPIGYAEEKKVVSKKSKKEKTPVIPEKVVAPLTEDDLIDKIIKGEGSSLSFFLLYNNYH